VVPVVFSNVEREMDVKQPEKVFLKVIFTESIAGATLLLLAHFIPALLNVGTLVAFVTTLIMHIQLRHTPQYAVINLSYLIASGVLPFFFSISGFYFNFVFFGVTLLIAHNQISFRRKEVVLILLLFIITFTNSILSKYSSGSSLGDSSTIYTIIFPISLFILILNTITTQEYLRLFYITLFIGILISSFDYLLTYNFGNIFDVISDDDYYDKGKYVKISGISNQVNFLASYIVYLVPITYHYFGKLKDKQKYLGYATIILLCFLLLFMSSRSALILLGGFILYKLILSNSVKLNIKFLIVLMVISSYVISVTYELPIIQKLKISSEGSGDDIRTAKIDEALQVFYDHPILGVGLNGYTAYSSLHYGNDFNTHNTLLSIISEQGIVGFVLFILIYLSPFVNFIVNKMWYTRELRTQNNAVLEYVLMIFVSFFFVHAHGDTNYYVFLALAINSTALIDTEVVTENSIKVAKLA
jgi:O-antigen ligase